MARWAAFLALTAVLLSVLLALARLSQQALPSSDDGAGDVARDGPTVGADPQFGPGALLVNVVLSQGLFGAAVVVGAVVLAIPPAALGVGTAPWVGGLPALALGVGFGVVVWLGAELATEALRAAGLAVDERLRDLLAPRSTVGWVALFGVALPLVALSEELLFRAALIGATAAGFGTSPWALAVVSAVAFALGHGAQGRAGVLVTGTLGFVLAAGFVLTGSLLVVVVAHYVVNALEFVVHERFGWDGLVDPEGAAR